MIVCTQFQMMYALVGPDEVVRVAGGVELGPFTVQYVHGCLDGQVTVTFLFGQMIGPFTSRLFRWMHEEGACDESLATKDWIGFFARVIDGTEPPSELARGNAAIAAFVATRTKDELLAAALERNLLIAPITTTSDVLALGQLRHREYWEEVEGVRFPGSIAKMSGSPLRVLGRPPRLGEHTEEVRAEPRRTPSAPPAADPPPAGRPLDGVKVLDFMWAFAGPYATRILADHGATVVKIETSHKVDVLRVVAPWNDPSQSVESALQYHSLNAGKLGLALDLSKPGARDVVLDLVRWADVVTESFSPKAMRAWDLGYDALRAVNPDLVMLSSCLMGQTGPMHRYAGFGTMAAAVAGFYPGVGWPDRPPCGPFTAYTDYTSPRFAVAVLLAALEWRRRTGEGQFIDFSQMEACLHLLAPELLDDAVNGRVAGRHGNRDRSRAPHGAYPTAGDDRWIAIAVETDEQWRALCAAASLPPDLAQLDTSARLSRQDELDALLSAWTARPRRRRAAGGAAAAGRAGAPSAELPPVRRRPATPAPWTVPPGSAPRDRHDVGGRQPDPTLAHARPSGVGGTDVGAAPARGARGHPRLRRRTDRRADRRRRPRMRAQPPDRRVSRSALRTTWKPGSNGPPRSASSPSARLCCTALPAGDDVSPTGIARIALPRHHPNSPRDGVPRRHRLARTPPQAPRPRPARRRRPDLPARRRLPEPETRRHRCTRPRPVPRQRTQTNPRRTQSRTAPRDRTRQTRRGVTDENCRSRRRSPCLRRAQRRRTGSR